MIENLATRFQSILQGATRLHVLASAHPKGDLPKEATEITARLTSDLITLPPGLIEPKVREELAETLRDPQRRFEKIGNLVEIVKPLFPNADWFVGEPGKKTRLIAPAPQVGMEKYFKPQRKGAPSGTPLVKYEVVSFDGKITPQPDDPLPIGLKGYRMPEAAALAHLLSPRSPQRLILVPGFKGTGKKTLVVRQLLDYLARNQISSLYVDASDSHTGLGTLKQKLRTSNPSTLIIDEVCELQQKHLKNFRLLEREIKRFLEKSGDKKVVLIGGGVGSTSGQETLLRYDLRKLAEEKEIGVVPVEVKQLNRLQAGEVLLGESAQLSLFSAVDQNRSVIEKELFVDFVLNRIPPYLMVLRQFRLHQGILTLEGALSHFKETIEKDFLISVLFPAGVFPEGAQGTDLLTPKVEKMLNRLDDDIEEILLSKK